MRAEIVVPIVSGGVQQPLYRTAVQPTYTVGGCTQFGSYLGSGAKFGSTGQYSVYRKDVSGGYDLNFVSDYGCNLVRTVRHTVPPSTAPQPVQHPATTTVSTSSGALTNTELYVVGGLAVGAALYFALRSKR